MQNSYNYSTFTDLLFKNSADFKQAGGDTASRSEKGNENETNLDYTSASSGSSQESSPRQRHPQPWRGE